MNTEIVYKGISIPFPVESPFAMRPNMRMLGPEEKILTTDISFKSYIDQKKKLYNPCYGDNADINLIRSAISSLKKYDSSFYINENIDGPVYNLTMSIQEDWVLFSPNKSGKLSAQVLSVHFPSGWDPKEKVNMTFSEIHEPVADNNLIMKASEHISNIICNKGPYVRHVWTISDSDDLSRHPKLIFKKEIENIDQLWYRCERQVTVPLAEEACLFLIRVYLVPLIEVFKDNTKKKCLIDSINSMSHAALEYKNLLRVKDLINRHDV